MKALILLALVAALPAQAHEETSELSSELVQVASARAGCGSFTIGSEEHSCVVAFFPDRVGARARFACGEEVHSCACTAQGAVCRRE